MSKFTPPDELLEQCVKRAEQSESGMAISISPMLDFRGYIAIAAVDLEKGEKLVRRLTVAELRKHLETSPGIDPALRDKMIEVIDHCVEEYRARLESEKGNQD